MESLLAAAALAPTNAHSLSTLSAAFLRTNRPEESLEAAAAAAAVDPLSAVAHNNHGLLLAGLGRHEEAIKDAYVLGLRLEPRDAELLCNLATSTAELGELSSAATFFAAALDADPAHARAKTNLAAIQPFLQPPATLPATAPSAAGGEAPTDVPHSSAAATPSPRPAASARGPRAGQGMGRSTGKKGKGKGKGKRKSR